MPLFRRERNYIPLNEQETTELLGYALEHRDDPNSPNHSHPAISIHNRLKQGLETYSEENRTAIDETYCEYLDTGNQSLVGKIWNIIRG